MIYRQVSVKWPKAIAVETSSCLGRSGSASGKLEPPNLAWAWPGDGSRCCRCPFDRTLSRVGGAPT